MRSVMQTESLAIDIALGEQSLRLLRGGVLVAEYPISTARAGAGEKMGSFCTPRGHHRIRAKIGAGMPWGTVFKGRRPTGEIYDSALAARFPERDWILSRILWLGGLEPGRNRYGEVDSQRRYIYIHGTPDTEPMGIPASIGCVRMRNDDVIELFDRVPAGTSVYLHE